MKTAVEPTGKDAVAATAPESAAADFSNTRLKREWKTLEAMVHIYCRDQHGSTKTVCADCRQLLDYARVRLERCRFGVDKPTCAHCPVHCYQRARREQVKGVMRHAGPRMVLEHPVLSVCHWLDGFRKAPVK